MIKTWFKIFYRNSKKNKLNIAVNILSLTLGFAGLMFVLLYLDDEKSYNAWNPEKNEVYRVVHKGYGDRGFWIASNTEEGSTFKQEIPEVLDYHYNSWYDKYIVKIDNEKEYLKKIVTGDSNFFEFFPFELIKGNYEEFKESKSNIAISDYMADKYFESENPIGKVLEIGNEAYIISTVFRANSKSYYNPNIVMQHKSDVSGGGWDAHFMILFCKLNKDSSKKEVEVKMDDLFDNYLFIHNSEKEDVDLDVYKQKEGYQVKLEVLKDIRLHSLSGRGSPEGIGFYTHILVMLGLSVLLLIISCVNLMNLSTSSIGQRSKEVGVKKTLGLTKTTIAIHYILEILFQVVISFMLSVVLIELILPYANNYIDKEMSVFNMSVISDISIVIILVSLVISIEPAMRLSNFKAVDILKGRVSNSKKGVMLRKIMLGFQFIISGVFMIGSMIIYSQVEYMTTKDLGYSGDQILIVKGVIEYKQYELIKDILIKHHNIEAINSSAYNPGGRDTYSDKVSYKGVESRTIRNSMDFGYLDFINVPLLEGRFLNEKFASDTISSILINETLAKALNISDDPIGKEIHINWYNDTKIVVGVFKDYQSRGFSDEIRPMFIYHWETYGWDKRAFGDVYFKIKPADMLGTINYIEKYWRKNVDAEYPFSYSFMNEEFEKVYEADVFLKKVFSILTSIIIMISLLGLFALSALNIQQRLKEVAIRKTLGASSKEIVYQLIKSFIKITLIASVFVIPLSYYLLQMWLDGFVYRIDMPLWPYLASPLLLLVLVMVVVGARAFNATKVDLIKYLKFE